MQSTRYMVSNRVIGPGLILTLVGIQVVAKSKYWYFIKQFKRVKRANGEIVAVNEVRAQIAVPPSLRCREPAACLPACVPATPALRTDLIFLQWCAACWWLGMAQAICGWLYVDRSTIVQALADEAVGADLREEADAS